MHFHSLLFVGGFLAIFETSSTRSSSTVVQPIASDRDDVPANAVGAKTTEEERGGKGLFGNFAEKGKDIVSSITGRNRLDEFESLKINENIDEQLRKQLLEVLANHVNNAPEVTKAMITQVVSHKHFFDVLSFSF